MNSGESEVAEKHEKEESNKINGAVCLMGTNRTNEPTPETR